MNIINAAFVRNGVTVRTLPVYQYDHGMILNISGLDDLPSTFRVDFANTETGQSKTVIGTDGQVHVPYEYFVPGATIHCWLVWTGADYAVTRKHIMIPVARRATPTDEEPTPDEQGVIDQAIAALNDAVEHTGQDVEAAAGYAEQAEQSAQAATDAKDNAMAAQNAARAYRDQAVQYTSDAAESAQSAFQSKTDAQAAAASVAGAMDTLEATIQADLQAAKESGMFDGADGVSPTVTVTPIIDGHQVMITDAEGEHSFDVTNGEPGTDGFSPVATVTKTQTGATISITDKAGTTTAQISNGAKGDPGDDYILTAADKEEIAQQAEELLVPVLDTKAPAIWADASGAIAHFEDGADGMPVKSLTVNIEPVQSGSGDPSPDNIRPITGWTGAKVSRTGKNLLPMPITSGSYANSVTVTVNDDLSFYITKANSSGWIKFKLGTLTLKAGTYTLIESDDSSQNATMSVYNENKGIEITNTRYNSRRVFTLEEDTEVLATFSRSAPATNVLTKLMLFAGDTATADDYEPYQGQTYDITFPSEAGTIYGGTLDVTNGVLTVDSELEVFDRVLENEIGSGLNYLDLNSGSVGVVGNYTRISFAGPSDRAKYNLISSTYARKMCNMLSHVFSYADKSAHWYRNTVLYAFFPTSAVGSTKESVITYLKNLVTAGTPLTFWIPLATPETYTLTASEITTLLGQNNIWADTGDVTVGYKADTKLYIDNKITQAIAAALNS